MQNSDAAETNRERAAIDGGHRGDKSPGLDLSCAPMGTDDEAAGVKPQLSMSPTTVGHSHASANSPSPSLTPAGQARDNHAWIAGSIAGSVLIAAGVIFAVLP